MTTTGTYEHILETMHDGVLALSDSGEVILFNKAASDILGIARDDVVGRRLMEIPFAEDERNDEFTQAVLSAVYKKGENLRIGAPYVRPDGEELYLDVATSFREQEDEKFNGVVMVFTDVTALRTQYEKERDLTAQLSEAYRDLEGETASMQQKVGRSRHTRRLSLAVILLIVLVGGGYSFFHFVDLGPSEGDLPMEMGAFSSTEVETKPVSMAVSLTGNFEPLEVVNVVSPFKGRILHKEFSFGQTVKKGDVLLELDISELMVKLREAESAYIKAKQEYEIVSAWDTSLEVSNAKRAFAKAKKSLDAARNKLAVSKDLLDRGIIPEDEHETQLNTFENLELDYTSSQEQLQAVRDKGSKENVLMAQMAMKNAQYTYDSVRAKIDQAEIAAPVDGLIIQPKTDGNSKAKDVEVGASFNEGDIILAVGNTEGFTVSTTADEVDMIKLRIGQPVKITGDGFPDMVLHGSVESISSQAEVGSGRDRVASFGVKILVDDLTPEQRERIKLGMMATMEVVTYDEPAAVVVPLDAVRKEGDAYVVDVATPQGTQTREVSVGMTTLDSVEIKKGLKPGDQVLTGDR